MPGLILYGIIVLGTNAFCLGTGSYQADSLTGLALLSALPGAFIGIVLLDDKLGGKGRGFITVGVLLAGCFLLGFLGRTPADNLDSQKSEETVLASSVEPDTYDESASIPADEDASDKTSSNTNLSHVPHIQAEKTYQDERWKTTHPDLLAIPEGQRWYNAREHMGTTCTVVGPVVDVYQAKDSSGMPIFVNIGATYPSSSCVTLLIWADDVDSFVDMLNDVDDGNAWISVTGYLNNYEGMPQFNSSMSYIEFTWWTNVS